MELLVKEPLNFRAITARLKTPWVLIALLLGGVLALDGANFIAVALFALDALIGTTPYIIIAVALIAALKASSAEARLADVFKGREFRMIVMAAFFGGLTPFCSCEVIPIVAALLVAGVPLSAIMAFWLSSPLIDPPTVFITAAALGWPFAIGKTVSAVLMGLFGGFVVAWLMRLGAFREPRREIKGSSSCCCAPAKDNKPVWKFWREAPRRNLFARELHINGLFLLKWLSLAYVLEALMVNYVPAELIAQVVGGEGLLPIVISALVGMPAYLNSYVAPALLAGLIEQGMGNGAAMAFLISGAVSSVPAMMAVFTLVRAQVFAAYIGLGLTYAVMAGLVFEILI